MKKYFETPAVETTTLNPDMDVMVASANLVNKKSNLSATAADTEINTEIWQGTDGGWL